MEMMNITPAQMEFFTEETLIKITPRFSHKELHLSCGTISSLTPGMPAEVPLWVALFLKSKEKCTVRIPDEYNLENLERQVEEERTLKDAMRPVAENFFELFRILYSR